MYIRLIIGFTLASLAQAAIVIFGETLNITSLNTNVDFLQLLIHFFTGIVAGYVLYFITINVKQIYNTNLYIVGIVYGIILWPVVLGIASAQGRVTSPLKQDMITIIWTLIAFIVYGIIAFYTIKKLELEV